MFLALISDWCVKNKWQEISIFSVPEDRKKRSIMQYKKFHKYNDSCVISRRPNARKESLSFNPSRLHRDSMVFFEDAVKVKKEIVIINDPFVSQCTVRMVDKPQDTSGKGPSCSLYVKHSDLRNESQGESRPKKTNKEETPLEDFFELPCLFWVARKWNYLKFCSLHQWCNTGKFIR